MCVCYNIFCQYAQRDNKTAIPTGSSLHSYYHSQSTIFARADVHTQPLATNTCGMLVMTVLHENQVLYATHGPHCVPSLLVVSPSMCRSRGSPRDGGAKAVSLVGPQSDCDTHGQLARHLPECHLVRASIIRM